MMLKKIASAAEHCGRFPKEVSLLAVSKTQSVSAIKKAINTGQYAFGENYVQEAIDKIAYFAHHSKLEWHFIGLLQSNKSRLVAEYFTFCHTVDSLKIAQRLSHQRPGNMPALNILIQINISGEKSKSGISLN